MGDTVLLFDPLKIARAYSHRFAEVDEGVDRVFFFPENSPEKEIRLIVVNTLIPCGLEPICPLHFRIVSDEGEESYRFSVVDVTPEQWERVLQGQLDVPAGWVLHGSQTVFLKQHSSALKKGSPFE